MITGNYLIARELNKKGGEQPTAGTPQQLPNVQQAECYCQQQPLQNQGSMLPPINIYVTVNPVIECRVTEKTKNSPLSDLTGPLGILSKLFNN